MRRRGFTLTELYLTLAFVAAVGLVFWNMTRKPDTRRSSCASNLKQLGLAALQYTQDFDGGFPPSTPELTWRSRVTSYLKRSALFGCPSDNGFNVRPGQGLDSGGQPSSYMANVNLCRPAASGNARHLANPALTILLCEFDAGRRTSATPTYRHTTSYARRAGLDLWDSYRAGTIAAETAFATEPHGPNRSRHNGDVGLAWADGHVYVHQLRYFRRTDTNDADGQFDLTEAPPAPAAGR